MRQSSPPDPGPSREYISLREGIELYLRYSKGRVWREASHRERLHALSVAVRRPSLDAMRESESRYREQDAKRLYYLSMEFLMGRALGNNLTNLGIYDEARAVVGELGDDLEELESLEADAALGNGGLGRLAACFLDSMASLDYPGFGYGINYEFGLFKQTFVNGYQHEKPDHWLSGGSPWLIERLDEAVTVPVYGNIAHLSDARGGYAPKWTDFKMLIGVPHDMPIVGYGGRTVNVLRLFSARSSDEFDVGIFNSGDYIRAVQGQIATEAISKILYPSDVVASGRELRLLQEYFLVGCSMRDIIKRYRETHDSFDQFASKVALQMNDTARRRRAAAVGVGVGDHRRHTRVHESHAPSGSAGDLVDRVDVEARSATPADHSGDQPPSAGRCGAAFPRRRTDAAAHLHHRRRRSADVESGDGRESFRQRSR